MENLTGEEISKLQVDHPETLPDEVLSQILNTKTQAANHIPAFSRLGKHVKKVTTGENSADKVKENVKKASSVAVIVYQNEKELRKDLSGSFWNEENFCVEYTQMNRDVPVFENGIKKSVMAVDKESKVD